MNSVLTVSINNNNKIKHTHWEHYLQRHCKITSRRDVKSVALSFRYFWVVIIELGHDERGQQRTTSKTERWTGYLEHAAFEVFCQNRTPVNSLQLSRIPTPTPWKLPITVAKIRLLEKNDPTNSSISRFHWRTFPQTEQMNLQLTLSNLCIQSLLVTRSEKWDAINESSHEERHCDKKDQRGTSTH